MFGYVLPGWVALDGTHWGSLTVSRFVMKPLDREGFETLHDMGVRDY